MRDLNSTRSHVIAVLIAAGLLLAGCGKGGAAKEAAAAVEQEPAVPVTVEPAVRGAIDHVVTADAVLYPINQANVTPKISAPVKRILVNRGDHVRVGQLLAELERGDLAAAAEETGTLPAGDPQILEIAAWVDELLEWTGIMLRSARAAQADELRRIPFLRNYLRQQSL